MAKKSLKNIFLSASIPQQERDAEYYRTADIFAIRDAVISLTSVAIPNCRLIWGGHPAITPLIYYILQKYNSEIASHVLLYQSRFFEDKFPPDNDKFKNIIFTERMSTRDMSLEHMREQMLKSHEYVAGIFIGGMEGVEEEYELFKKYQQNALLLPIGSTGGAAKLICERDFKNNDDLLNNYAYWSLFERYLMDNL